MEQNLKLAVIGIIIKDRKDTARKVNEILGDYGDIVVGRMGLPYKDRDLSVISIIVDGSNDQIGALSGKLGNIAGVKAKVVVVN
ncbi:MAG: TM1266 family iron-only hydrogenase system putative regulator [Ruminiclostridium sp.]